MPWNTAPTTGVPYTRAPGQTSWIAPGRTALAWTEPTSSGEAVTHGDQLTVGHVGPWSLQGVAKGSEILTPLSGPSRGYFRFDTPADFTSTAAWPANANDSNPSTLNNPALTGGVVTGSPVTIDGYSIPVGTYICQFRDMPNGYDFYVQGSSNKVLFRGCRFRFTSGVGGAGLFNDNGAPAAQQTMVHYCDVGLTSLDPPNGSQALMHMKFLGGSGHRVLRNYLTRSATMLQPNVTGVRIIENIIDELIFAYGEGGTTGAGGSSILHLNGISSEGGLTNAQYLRNRITLPSPDGATGSTGSGLGQIGYGTQPGQTGYGIGSNPGRLVTQTDCIAVFAITGSNNGVTIDSNYLGGGGVVLYAGNANGGATNIVLTNNKITTRWWTNGGNFGSITDQPAWGTNGNVKSNNTWADDYGTGGNGATAVENRQYPAGNGPRAGQTFV